MKIIDLNTWKRKEHFEFFSSFDDPMFGFVTNIDCTNAYNVTKEKNHSFFAYYMHKSLLAANKIEEFKYRIVDGNAVIYDEIHASPTIGRDDGTFGFSFVAFNQDFTTFCASLKKEIAIVENSGGLRLDVDAGRINTIYYSTLPWSSFTGLTYPRNVKDTSGIPQITFGKLFTEGERKLMPVSLHAHHALVDGLHLANFLEIFQALLDE